MTKNFDDNYDMFVNLTSSILYDNVLIEKISQKYIMSNAELEDKKSFLKLKKEYYKIKNIENYKGVQEKLYENKSRAEILTFELSRILKQNADKPDVLEHIASIQSILSSYKGEITDEVYKSISSIIIFLEISLGMKIGLFRELCSIFENKLQEIAMMEVKNCKRK